MPSDPDSVASEDALIAEYLRPLAHPAALEFRDDAAVITPRAGYDLVITSDALVAGVHFFADDRPEDIATKAITANLSDLVAKGAWPVLGYQLVLALPKPVAKSWIAGFVDGLVESGVRGKLLGGDCVATPGPLMVSVTAIGEVATGRAVRRTGARPGDRIYLAGPIGASTLGLRYFQDMPAAKRHGLAAAELRSLVRQYMAPVVPFADLRAAMISEFASASMDLSDGLMKDLGRLVAASGVGAQVELAAIPLDPLVARLVSDGHVPMMDILTGGDDYVPLFTVPAERLAAFEHALATRHLWHAHAIGVITAVETPPLTLVDRTGEPVALPARTGFDHF